MEEYKRDLVFPNLTPIRFFLALLVIVFHVQEFCKNRGFPYFDSWPLFVKGTESVYVFFVLSGFLIIRGLYTEKEHMGTISLKRFFIKRAFRILPLYYVVLFFGFFYYQLVLSAMGFPVDNSYNLIEGILLSVTLFANIFANYSPGGIIEILWSIAIEEQFYLFIAPVLLCIRTSRFSLFLALFSVAYFLLYFYGPFDFLRANHMLFFYFTSGGLAAVLLRNNTFCYCIRKMRGVIYGGTVIYFFTFLFGAHLDFAAYHLLGMLLLALFVAALALFPLKWLEHRMFYRLGNVSYAMYMLHPIVMQFVGFLFLKELIPVHTPFAFILIFNLFVVSLTVLSAFISRRYFEGYFMRLRDKILKRENL